METYDFRDGSLYGVPEAVDQLSQKEMLRLKDMLETIKGDSEMERAEGGMEWLRNAIVPVLKDFAEMTSSLLCIEELDGRSAMVVTVRNGNGMDVTESCKCMKALMVLASHIGINAPDGTAELTMVFDCMDIFL